MHADVHAMPRQKDRLPFHLPSGWWLLPAILGGAACWIWLGSALFRVLAG
jgi:hypothetical protein